MIVGRVCISFDRGVARNDPEDLDLEELPEVTSDHVGIVRGIGTHYRDAIARDNALRWATEGRRVRNAFNHAFLKAPIPGVYVLPERDAADKHLATMSIDPSVRVRIAVYDLSPGRHDEADVAEWVTRVREQMNAAPLGRGKEIDAAGLDVLERLTLCPVFSDRTALRLRELLAQARLDKMPRPEFKRQLAAIDVEIDIGPVAAPRRPRPSAPKPAPVETTPDLFEDGAAAAPPAAA